MAWSTSSRRHRLPPDWSARRKAQLTPGATPTSSDTCQYRHSTGRLCGAKATDVDHIVAMVDNHDELQSLCGFHHRMKSSQEGHAAKAAKAEALRKKFRRTETHPGLIP